MAGADTRNVALVGHGGAGKTTLGEAMLFAAKAVSRQGRVGDGNTVSDFAEDERERGHSIDTALLRADWKGKSLQIIDTPGYPDFVGCALRALDAVDCAIVVVNAYDGVALNTRRLFKAAGDLIAPERLVRITGTIDRGDKGTKIRGSKIGPLAEAQTQTIKRVHIRLTDRPEVQQQLPRLLAVFKRHPGSTAISLTFRTEEALEADTGPLPNLTVTASDHFVADVEEVLVDRRVNALLHHRPVAPRLARCDPAHREDAGELDLVLDCAVLVEIPEEPVLVVPHRCDGGEHQPP